MNGQGVKAPTKGGDAAAGEPGTGFQPRPAPPPLIAAGVQGHMGMRAG